MMASTTQALMVVAIVIFVSRILFKQQNLKLPSGPTALLIIGCLHLLGKQPYKDLANLARKYGPVMSVPLGQKYCVVGTSPEAAKEFLQLQDANFSSRPPMRSAKIICTKATQPNSTAWFPFHVNKHGHMALFYLFIKCLISLSDIIFHDITPVNRHLRRVLVSEFTSAKRVEASKYIRREEIANMLRTIAKETGRPIRVSTYVSIMSSNILTRMILNKLFLGGEDQSNASEVHEFIKIVEEQAFVLGAIQLQDLFNFVPDWFDPQGLGVRCRKLRAFMDVFNRNMIVQHKEDRRKNPISEGEKTLLDVLLEQLDHSDHVVTEEHIEGVIWDIFGARTGTTTMTVEWAMAEVLRNPTVLKIARLELNHVVGLNRALQESDIPQFKYIQVTCMQLFF